MAAGMLASQMLHALSHSQSQPRQAAERDAVMDQGVAAENAEEENSLRHLAHLWRNAGAASAVSPPTWVRR